MNKKVLFTVLLVLSSFIMGCSKDDENESVFEAASEENIKTFEAISEDISTYLELNANATYEEIQDYLGKYSTQISSVVEDSFLYVTTPGGLEIQIDGYGLSAMDDSDFKFNEDNFMTQVSTIDKSLGIEDNNSTRAFALSDKYDTIPITRGTRNDERILNSRRIMLWAPWTELDIYEFQRTIHAIASAYHLDFEQERDEYIGNDCTFESMKLFNGYDIVVLVCHGNSRGQLVVPYTSQWKTRIGKGARIGDIYVMNNKKYARDIVLDKDMASCLPNDMSKTILWTGMCYAFSKKSAIKEAVQKSNAADFFGATGKVDKNVVIPYLSQFAVRFYRGATTAEAFYPKTPRKTYYSYVTKSGEKGLYCKGDIDNVFYQYPICLPVKGNMLRGCRATPYNKAQTRSVTRASGNADAGFWIKNTETGKEITIPFSETSKVSYKTYNYGDIITSYIYECKTDELEMGTYEYKTYEHINGHKYYSDETYVFSKTENFKVTLNFSVAYTHISHSTYDGKTTDWGTTNTKDKIEIIKLDGNYYTLNSIGVTDFMYINNSNNRYYKESSYSYETPTEGNVLCSINGDNVNITFKTTYIYHQSPIWINHGDPSWDETHYSEGSITINNIDSNPTASVEYSHGYGGTNNKGTYKHTYNYVYEYTGFEKKDLEKWEINSYSTKEWWNTK